MRPRRPYGLLDPARFGLVGRARAALAAWRTLAWLRASLAAPIASTGQRVNVTKV